MNIRILVPLTLNSSLVGIILLGTDPSRGRHAKSPWQRLVQRHTYRKEIELLEKLRFHASVSISHSLLYDRIVKLNESLEQKVKERTRELEETTAQLVQSEKMASMGMLVAGVAHEINTPSGVVQGSVDNIFSAIDRLIRVFPDMARHNVSIRDYLALVQLIRGLVKDPNQKSLYGKKKFQAVSAMQKRIEKFWDERKVSCEEDSRDLAGYAVEYNLDASLPSFLLLGHKYGFKRLIGILEGFGNLGISLANIQSAIGNIVRIVKALKTYSHIDSSQVSEVPVEQGIDNTLVIMQNQVKQLGQLQLDYQARVPIICYFDELNQVWTNLINNAIQAIEERIAQGELVSEESLLTIKTAQVDSVEQMAGEYDYEAPLEQSPYHGPWIRVEIADNGHGIPDKIKQQIFQPFFTTKQHGKGTGLGLGIVMNILQKHNGRLFLSSRPGQTRMGLALPRDWLKTSSPS
jgi:signal transduction histidine kinase